MYVFQWYWPSLIPLPRNFREYKVSHILVLQLNFSTTMHIVTYIKKTKENRGEDEPHKSRSSSARQKKRCANFQLPSSLFFHSHSNPKWNAGKVAKRELNIEINVCYKLTAIRSLFISVLLCSRLDRRDCLSRFLALVESSLSILYSSSSLPADVESASDPTDSPSSVKQNSIYTDIECVTNSTHPTTVFFYNMNQFLAILLTPDHHVSLSTYSNVK